MRGAVALGDQPTDAVRSALAASPSMDGLDLATRATIGAEYTEGPADAQRHIVAYDYGMKRNILRLFLKNGCRVTVVPATTPAARVRELAPDGLFLSNGPGDPAAVSYAITTLHDLADGSLPIFGICLGHQLLGLALGGETVKLQYGILRRDKYLSPHKTTASRSGAIREASPVLRRLRSRTLTSTIAPSKG